MPIIKTRTLIADNNRLVCFAIKEILGDSDLFEVVDTLHHPTQISKNLLDKDVDLVFISINLINDELEDAVRKSREANPSIKFIGLMSDSMGAALSHETYSLFNGMIDKEHDMEALLLVSKLVMNGFRCVPFDKFGHKATAKASELTKRERQVLGYMKQGMNNRDIASTINISHKTVSVHRYNIMYKMGIKNQMELYKLGGAHVI